jgi:predicted DNA-binding protein
MGSMVDDPRPTMYVYIMQRTQIYLSQTETTALDREAKRTGRTRSQLIREAIEEKYVGSGASAEEFLRVLEETSGAWKDRDFTGQEYVDAIRSGFGERMARLWGEPAPGEGGDAPPGR